MLRVPSSRRRQIQQQGLNLVPILDAIFVFIFFLITSSSFVNIKEISSDIPIFSAKSPPSNKKPLAITLQIEHSKIVLLMGSPSRQIRQFPRIANKSYDLESLHFYLVNNIKMKFPKEREIILEPLTNLPYGEIVKIMDAIRILRLTDPAFYSKAKKSDDSLQERHFNLFDKIVFSNIQDISG